MTDKSTTDEIPSEVVVISPINALMDINVANTLFFTAVFVVGVPSNAIIILAYQKIQKSIRSARHSAVTVRALAVSDILICAAVFARFANLKNNLFLCRLEFFLHVSLLQFSMCVIVGIAFERYLSICRPWVAFTKKHIVSVVGVCTVISVAASLTMSLKLRVVSEDVCVFDLEVLQVLAIASYLFFQLTAVVLIVVLYGLVFKVIYSRRQNRISTVPRLVVGQTSCRYTVPPSSSGTDERVNSESIEGKYKTRTVPPSSSRRDERVNSESTEKCNTRTAEPRRNHHSARTVDESIQAERSEMVSAVFVITGKGVPPVRPPALDACTSSANTGNSLNRPQDTGRRVEEYRTAVAFCSIAVILILSWMPFWLSTFSAAFDWNLNVPLLLSNLYYINAVSNPFLYGVFDKRVRKYLSKFKC